MIVLIKGEVYFLNRIRMSTATTHLLVPVMKDVERPHEAIDVLKR
jgi:hypothetical protein